MQQVTKGFLCVIEGADGAGKTTVTELIQEKLERWIQDYEIVADARLAIVTPLREPHFLRDVIKATGRTSNWLRLLYFFIRDREEHCLIMREMMKDGHFILMDRFYHSSCVYQGLQSELGPEEILKAHPEWLLKPDVTVILNIGKEEADRRLGRRKEEEKPETEDIFDDDDPFQDKVRALYGVLSCHEGFEDCVEVSAEHSPEIVAELAFGKIEVVLKRKFLKNKEPG